MRVVLISGKRCAGKDYVGALLLAALGVEAVKINLADMLKMEYAARHGLDYHRLLNDREFKERHRAGLIEMALAERALDEAVWVKKLLDMVTVSTVIVCDFRFRDEVESFRRAGCNVTLIRVVASEHTKSARGWVHAFDGHARQMLPFRG